MAKKLIFETISLGTEPAIPGAGKLAEWVGAQRGRKADLVSYLLEVGLIPQQDAGVTLPCAGGIFYGERWKESFLGLTGGQITGELDVMPDYVSDDAMRIREISATCRVALPAPHQLSLADRYYGDEDEASFALYSQYRRLFRAMRDRGVSGHVLHCSHALPEELETLAGKNVFFYMESSGAESMATILEHQQVLAVKMDDLSLLLKMGDEYVIDRVIIVDPGMDDLREALQFFDPDCIQVGGFCTTDSERYWESLVESSTISL